ncbi:hypothetical protein PIB30_088806, partial [Stylosanthes scabra]|nr:hypothetical protein [Stylosanthes scabra]
MTCWKLGRYIWHRTYIPRRKIEQRGHKPPLFISLETQRNFIINPGASGTKPPSLHLTPELNTDL